MSTYEDMRYQLLVLRRIPSPTEMPISTVEIAQQAGTTDKNIRRWECAQAMPFLPNFVKWAGALGRQVVLTDGDGETFTGQPLSLIGHLTLRRELADWSATALAEYIGHVHTTVLTWENGTSWPFAHHFVTYAEAVGLTVELVEATS